MIGLASACAGDSDRIKNDVRLQGEMMLSYLNL